MGNFDIFEKTILISLFPSISGGDKWFLVVRKPTFPPQMEVPCLSRVIESILQKKRKENWNAMHFTENVDIAWVIKMPEGRLRSIAYSLTISICCHWFLCYCMIITFSPNITKNIQHTRAKWGKKIGLTIVGWRIESGWVVRCMETESCRDIRHTYKTGYKI